MEQVSAYPALKLYKFRDLGILGPYRSTSNATVVARVYDALENETFSDQSYSMFVYDGRR
jgi:hypothetical protein